jgi:hypothetical protein
MRLALGYTIRIVGLRPKRMQLSPYAIVRYTARNIEEEQVFSTIG